MLIYANHGLGIPNNFQKFRVVRNIGPDNKVSICGELFLGKFFIIYPHLKICYANYKGLEQSILTKSNSTGRKTWV